MNDTGIREKAARTAVDSFIAVERIYRHAHQTLTVLKDKLKDELKLKTESPMWYNSSSSSDPTSWIHRFRGLYLAHSKPTLELYSKKEFPLLFLQASLYNPNKTEPILRYGIIEKMFNMSEWKGVRFDEHFRYLLSDIHAEPRVGEVKASRCEAIVQFDEKPLLDVRQDSDIVELATEIGERYGNSLLK